MKPDRRSVEAGNKKSIKHIGTGYPANIPVGITKINARK